jgi:hypothetical protein
MREKILGLSVRTRIVLSSIAATILIFVMTTPLLTWSVDLLRPPKSVENIEVTQTENEVKLKWTLNDDIDIKAYELTISGESIAINKNIDNYAFTIQTYPTELAIKSVDYFGMKSEGVGITINKIDSKNLLDQRLLNEESDNDGNKQVSVYRRSIFIALVIYLLTLFIIQNQSIRSLKGFIISLYPSIVTLPYLLLTIAYLFTNSTEISKLLSSGIFSIVFYIVIYFVFLTVNILNTSLTVKIPLEQAARASQFVFSLISSYVALILFFGADYTFVERVIIIGGFIFYYSFASIFFLNNVTRYQAIIRSLVITLVIIAAMFILSIWPINYIYAILSIAVCFYVLLSVALEVRPNLSKYVWVEYIVLFVLVFFLLILNSKWGINGLII